MRRPEQASLDVQPFEFPEAYVATPPLPSIAEFQLLNFGICFMQLGLSVKLHLIGNVLSSVELSPVLRTHVPDHLIGPILNRCSLRLCLMDGDLGVFLGLLNNMGCLRLDFMDILLRM